MLAINQYLGIRLDIAPNDFTEYCECVQRLICGTGLNELLKNYYVHLSYKLHLMLGTPHNFTQIKIFMNCECFSAHYSRIRNSPICWAYQGIRCIHRRNKFDNFAVDSC